MLEIACESHLHGFYFFRLTATRWISFHLSLSIPVNFLEKKLCEKCLRQYCKCCGKGANSILLN